MSAAYESLAGLDDDQSWRAQAVCRGVSPELFYGERGSNDWKHAKAVCQTCPVREPCLDHAIRAGERLGVWGGLSEKERQPLRAAWRRERKAGGENERVTEAHRLRSLGWTSVNISRAIGVAVSPVYRYLDRVCGVPGCWCAATPGKEG